MELINKQDLWSEIMMLPHNGDIISSEEVEQVINEMPVVDVVSKGLFEQYKWERDIAIEQIEELGLSLGQKIDTANMIPREQFENLKEAFVDFVCSGTNNPAPYCKNRCDECTDSYGYCNGMKCNGFNPDGRM